MPIDFDELRRHRQLHALHGYLMGHDDAYAAEHRRRQKADRQLREAKEAKVKWLLSVAPEVGDQVVICLPGSKHDGATGTVKAIRIDHACAQVLATVDLKPKARTTALPAWARRQRGYNPQPHGVVTLAPLVQRIESISVLHLRPAQVSSERSAALAENQTVPQECDSHPALMEPASF
jgi:hypothetical protein